MPLMSPYGIGVDFTWALTIGVVVYSFLAFAGYFIYSLVAKTTAKRSQNMREESQHEQT